MRQELVEGEKAEYPSWGYMEIEYVTGRWLLWTFQGLSGAAAVLEAYGLTAEVMAEKAKKAIAMKK